MLCTGWDLAKGGSSLPLGSELGRKSVALAQSGRARGTEPEELACVFHMATIWALCFEFISSAADSTVVTVFAGSE